MPSETGSRSRTVIEKEILPPASQSTNAKASEFYDRDWWELMADISRQRLWLSQSAKEGHLVRVYRADDRWTQTGSPPENKFTESFNEETIRSKWGGGRYILWLYGPPEASKVVAHPYRLELEGPKLATALAPVAGGDHTALLLQELLTELRASRGGNLGEQAMKNALDIQFRAMSQAIELVRPAIPAAAAPSRIESLVDKLIEGLIPVLLSKFTNPADPIQEFGKVADAVTKVVGTLGGGKETKPDSVAAILSALPGVIDRTVGGMKEWRLGMEAQRDALRFQTQTKTIDVPATQQPAATDNHNNISQDAAAPAASTEGKTAAVNPAEAPQEVVTVMFDELIFHKIVQRIETDPSCTGEHLYDFIEATVPQYIEELSKHSREEIVAFFRTNRVLAKIADHPRLPQIIDQFLETAKKAQSES